MNDEKTNLLKKAKKKLIIKLLITYLIALFFLADCMHSYFSNKSPFIQTIAIKSYAYVIVFIAIASLVICTTYFLIKNYCKFKNQIEKELPITAKQKNNWFLMIGIVLTSVSILFLTIFSTIYSAELFELDEKQLEHASYLLPETYLLLNEFDETGTESKVCFDLGDSISIIYNKDFSTSEGKTLSYSVSTLNSNDNAVAKCLYKAGKRQIKDILNETDNMIFGKNNKGLFYYTYKDGVFAGVEIITDAETMSRVTNKTIFAKLQELLNEVIIKI